MFAWLKRILKMEENNKNAQQPIEVKVQNTHPIIEREFEIAVYDVTEDDNGKNVYRPVLLEKPMIIKAKSPQDLKTQLNLFKSTGQIAKIIREITDPTKLINTQQIKQVNNIQQQNNQFNSQIDTNLNIQNPIKQEVKYYTVGGIDIKDDNGKIYQKQWMKLSDKEMENIRVVNTANNRVINMNGKHIELKRWVLVENTDKENIINLEDLL